MTCQRRAGSVQSVQDGLPDLAAGVFTDSYRHQSLHHGLRPHDCCSGKTRSGTSVARYQDTVLVWLQPLCQGAVTCCHDDAQLCSRIETWKRGHPAVAV